MSTNSCVSCGSYLLVLIGGNCNELRFGKIEGNSRVQHERQIFPPLSRVGEILLKVERNALDIQFRLIAMHRM